MNPSLLLDSDVLIDYLRGTPAAVAFVVDHAGYAAIPAIVVTELYAGARGAAEIATLQALTEALVVLPVTVEIARSAGLLKARYGPSHGVGLADAMVAATALEHGLSLATLNTRHFPMIPGLERPYAREPLS
ncbi:MAG: type II toxin-antitoxin system VapC family toxin [Armatimonadetes bacterium]|nr:type II toxin-antitoxin system VapC family toxin [Armatimonadota bacterium]